MADNHDEGGFPSWIFWIVGLLALNGLSWLFNWGFYLW